MFSHSKKQRCDETLMMKYFIFYKIFKLQMSVLDVKIINDQEKKIVSTQCAVLN